MAKTEFDYNFMGTFIPAGTKLPMEPSACSIPKKPGQKIQMSLAQLLTLIMIGKFRPYIGNRGGNNLINKETFKSVVEKGLISDVAGEFSYGVYANEGEEHLTMCCWHSRSKGCIVRYMNGEMTNAELKSVISVSYVADFLKAYQAHGISGQAHTTKMKIRCMDYAFGEHIKKVEDSVGPVIKEKLKGFSTPLAAIIYTMEMERKNIDVSWYWPNVYGRRAHIKEVADKLRGTLHPTEEQYAKLVEAVLYWNELMGSIEQNSGFVKVGDIRNSAGLFGYFVAKHYATKMREFPKDIRVIAKRILQNFDQVIRLAPALCRNDSGVKDSVYDLEFIILKRKKIA